MPYKDKEKQREFQRKAVERRRLEFFSNKSCQECGSSDSLGLFRTNPNEQKATFSMSIPKLEQLARTQKILCSSCMEDKLVEGARVKSTKHGHAAGNGSPTYNSWEAMKRRCTDRNHDKYDYYGGRGIKVCDRWLESFENFLTDMGERPYGMTLDRINPDGNYEPSNCRWATQEVQLQNRIFRKRKRAA